MFDNHVREISIDDEADIVWMLMRFTNFEGCFRKLVTSQKVVF